MYPLFFNPIHKERIWGGQKLADKYSRKLEYEKVGESWEIACHENGMGIIQNGPLKGMSLKEAIGKHGEELLGSAVYNKDYKKFPLLIKIIDAADSLSVQVHPDDNYVNIYQAGELGKTEMWYVIDAKPGARLVYGLIESCEKESFRESIGKGSLEDCLHEIEVKAGDVLYIPAGLVHAIGGGILICEIQQNSDTTYRVYDWNRVDDNGQIRQLHIDQAMDVIDFDSSSRGSLEGLRITEPGGQHILYIATDYFAMDELRVDGMMSIVMDGRRFQTITCIKGEGDIDYNDGHVSLFAGTSCLLPASLSKIDLSGNGTFIRAWIPDKQQIIQRLEEQGYSKAQMSVIPGLNEIL